MFKEEMKEGLTIIIQIMLHVLLITVIMAGSWAILGSIMVFGNLNGYIDDVIVLVMLLGVPVFAHVINDIILD